MQTSRLNGEKDEFETIYIRRRRPPAHQGLRMIETSLDQVWEALEDVKDPEIPTVSVVELGLIRQWGSMDPNCW